MQNDNEHYVRANLVLTYADIPYESMAGDMFNRSQQTHVDVCLEDAIVPPRLGNESQEVLLAADRHHDAVEVRRPKVPVVPLRPKCQNKAGGRYRSNHEPPPLKRSTTVNARPRR